MERSVNILGVRFDVITRADAEKKISDALHEKRYINVFTPNPTIVMRTHDASELTALLNSSDISVADGIGILLASRLLGTPLPERIAGIDLGESILAIANELKLRVFLLGGKEGVAEAAAKRISCKYPELTVCGIHHGYFNKSGEDNAELIKRINEVSPDILFVCFGFPEQELWIAQNHSSVSSVKICVGLGGSIDVWAGNIRRAPKVLQKIGAEWLWRMILQPKRFVELFSILRFLICVMGQKARNIRSHHSHTNANKENL